MKEHLAEAREAPTIEDVHGDTFVRFIEWAHRGHYTAAKFTTEDLDAAALCTEDDHTAEVTTYGRSIPIIDADSQDFNGGQSPGVPDISFEVTEEDNSWSGYSRKYSSKKKSKKTELWPEPSPEPSNARTPRKDLMQSFISRRPVERKDPVELPPTRRNQNSAEVYSDVFLSHARLYVFAEEYDIQPLKLLALDELHATLKIFHLYPKRTGDIVNLLRYVYANTGEPREGVEDMRALMTQYVGYEMDTLIHDEGFKDLMIENGGPLLSDFMTMVEKRIS